MACQRPAGEATGSSQRLGLSTLARGVSGVSPASSVARSKGRGRVWNGNEHGIGSGA
jgi:hypothetical protein